MAGDPANVTGSGAFLPPTASAAKFEGSSFAALAVDALAVHRLVRLVQDDSLLDRPREWMLRRWSAQMMAELLTCPWCLSIWVAAGVVGARAVCPLGWGVLARVLALSTAAGKLSETI